MLTSDLAMSWQRGNRINPRYIDAADATHLQTAEDLMAIVRDHLSHRRAELEQALDEYVGTGTDYRILRGFIKLLMDRCVLATMSEKEPAIIRQTLFLKARTQHPVIKAEQRQQLIAEIAQELDCAPESILEGLYADLRENERLMDFDEPDARQLLDHYNLAQAQALLYHCVEITLRAETQEPTGYRQLFQAIKRYGLIHTIKGEAATGYEIILSGPVSLFHRSQKYGIQMAVFLPALLACRNWQMRAEIETKNGSAFYELDSRQEKLPTAGFLNDTTTAHSLLEKFARNWARLSQSWIVEACQEVIDLDGVAFVPDAVLQHQDDGRKIYLEFFGFWTPRYLQQRLQEFERSGFSDYVLLLSEELRGSRDAPDGLPPNIVMYKSSPDARVVLRALQFCPAAIGSVETD